MGHDEAPPVSQNREAALEEDLRLTAEAHGWTYEEAQARHRSSVALGRVTATVDLERPEIFIGGALAEDPEAAPRLYIKGPADDWVKGLVEDAAVPIIIVDDQPYSWRQMESRVHRVHLALREMGFAQVATWPDITDRGRIHADVLATPDSIAAESAIRLGIPEDLRGSVELTIVDAPFNSLDHAQGGMKTTEAGGPHYCTSGWSVTGPDGDGVVEAWHCRNEGINRIGADEHVMTRRDGYYSSDGDVEYLTTNTAEWALFYYDDGETRAVEAVRPASMIQVGDTVCLYGKASGKHCNLEVHHKGAECDGAGGFVVMNGSMGRHGDSGGPWYHDTTAYGVHHGECGSGGWDAFSLASRIPDAMPGVAVMTQ